MHFGQPVCPLILQFLYLPVSMALFPFKFVYNFNKITRQTYTTKTTHWYILFSLTIYNQNTTRILIFNTPISIGEMNDDFEKLISEKQPKTHFQISVQEVWIKFGGIIHKKDGISCIIPIFLGVDIMTIEYKQPISKLQVV